MSHLVTYASSFFGNCGNYLSFGDLKFVPRCSKESFRRCLSLSPDLASHGALLNALIDGVYDLSEHERELGWQGKGVSSYYLNSSNLHSSAFNYVDSLLSGNYYCRNISREEVDKIQAAVVAAFEGDQVRMMCQCH